MPRALQKVLFAILTTLEIACATPPPLEDPTPAPIGTASAPPDEVTSARAALGKRLFFDPRLSSNEKVSCASCHELTNGGNGTTKTAVARGVGDRLGARNPGTVWNAGLRSVLFWDGRADDLEAQVRGPITNHLEMDMAPEAVVRRLERVPGYRDLFHQAFRADRRASGRDRIAFDEIASAIAAFERTLTTPDAPFDRACRGEHDAILPSAWRGWRTFQSVGCVACHGAPTFTNTDWFARFPQRSVPDLELALGFTRDPGRGAVVSFPNARNTWRVPSLRNVAITAPYFHNGSVMSLEQAVRIMGRAQLAKTLSDQDVEDLVAFLESLTAPLPSILPPELPPDE
jgi:cytochrome c peroxidase